MCENGVFLKYLAKKYSQWHLSQLKFCKANYTKKRTIPTTITKTNDRSKMKIGRNSDLLNSWEQPEPLRWNNTVEENDIESYHGFIDNDGLDFGHCCSCPDAKNEEIASNVIDDVTCFACKEVPSPENNKRFLCEDNQHPLCKECSKKACLCDSKVSAKSSKIMEKLVKLMPWYCRNYAFGCQESFKCKHALKKHERHGRPIFNCKVGGCKMKTCSDLDVNIHFDEEHVNTGCESLFECSSAMRIPRELKCDLKTNYLLHVCKTKTDGWIFPVEVDKPSKFFISGKYKDGSLRLWLQILCSSEDAKRYEYSLTALAKAGKFSYEGKLSSCEVEEDPRYNDTIGNKSGLFLSKQVLESCENDRLIISLTIKYL